MKVRPSVSRIVGLTGTPSSNILMDLFAEFRLLDLGERLGKFITRYREAFFQPDKRPADRIFSWKPRPGAEQEIYRRIGDITVIDAKSASALCTKLSQLAGGAVYAEDGSTVRFHDRKLEALSDLIEGANGYPILIAYWFRHDLTRIQEAFPSVRHLVSAADMADWNAGKIPVAAIHPASAGHDLNLQSGGNTLVWFSLTWSLELYQQTNARLYRQGQQSDTVVIHHLITKGTIDEQIMAALKRKDQSQEALMEAVKANLKGE